MRFRRIRIKDYRGIDESEILFPEGTGVTIIEGPNEIGKTSHIEAVDLLLSEYATSKKRSVKALKPVHKDAGPTVELEAECGKYRFTYKKRFLVDPMTELTVHSPREENLTGREAHHRVEEILSETIDLDLWRALRIVQGAAIEQPDLRKSSLLKALDEAAGTSTPIGDDEMDLFDAVEKEYQKYWTKTGKEKDETKQLRTQVLEAEKQLLDIEKRIAAVNNDVENLKNLNEENDGIEDTIRDLKKRCSNLEKSAEAAHAQEKRIHEEKQRLDGLKKALEVAQAAEKHRTGKRAECTRAREALTVMELEFKTLESNEKTREGEEKKTRDQVNTTEQRVKELTRELSVREQDVHYRRSELNKQLLGERLKKADDAHRNLSDARKELTANRLDDAAIKELEEKHTAVKVARARFEDQAARVEMNADKSLELEIQGESTKLGSGESREWSVTEDLDFRIPGLLSIKVAPGMSTQDLQDTLDAATNDLAATLERHGVGSVEEARTMNKRHNKALQNREASERARKEALRDLTQEELRDKVHEAEQIVSGYPENRTSSLPLPPDAEEAKRIHADVKEQLEEATAKRDRLREHLDDLQETRNQTRTVFHDKKAKIELERERVERLTKELEEEETTETDDQVKKRLEDAKTAHDEQNDLVQRLQAELERLDPVSLKTLIENAKNSLTSNMERQRRIQSDLDTIKGRLEAKGEEGLEDARFRAERETEKLRRKLHQQERDANAAKRLFRLFEEKRSQATRAYVAPLEQKIQELGRLVYGPSFKIRIGEDLSIEERTLHGITVPYDSLSGGVKEQLAILHRLACASIASATQGVPVILDDTMGQTDPRRLEGMGAALAKTSEDAQVILLTCTPARFRNVGGARSINLQASTPGKPAG